MKYPKPIIHSSASKLVVRTLLRVKREMNVWNIREVSRRLNVNQRYVCENLKYGREPTDNTFNGREVRARLGLKRYKKKVKLATDKPKSSKPDFIVAWDHLPKEERHKVIKQYLQWKDKK